MSQQTINRISGTDYVTGVSVLKAAGFMAKPTLPEFEAETDGEDTFDGQTRALTIPFSIKKLPLKGDKETGLSLEEQPSPHNVMQIGRTIVFPISPLDMARWFLQEFMLFPTSYNQMLVMGILAYCIKLLSRPEASTLSKLNQSIKIVIDKIGSLYSQYYDNPDSFPLLDLQMLEDKFELLQERSKTQNLLPDLDNIEILDL